jgi:hypothetical protein
MSCPPMLESGITIEYVPTVRRNALALRERVEFETRLQARGSRASAASEATSVRAWPCAVNAYERRPVQASDEHVSPRACRGLKQTSAGTVAAAGVLVR